MLENFTETSFSDNRPIPEEEDQDSIVRGGTSTHVFELPFLCTNYVEDLNIIYKQGLEIVLTKEFTDCLITEDEDNSTSTLTLKLSSEDTLQFEQNLLDVYVQLRISTIDSELLYNTPIKLILEPTLDNYREETSE